MARVRNIPSSELPPATREVYERYASAYGPFANQVAVFAHVPPAVDHLMSMLMLHLWWQAFGKRLGESRRDR